MSYSSKTISTFTSVEAMEKSINDVNSEEGFTDWNLTKEEFQQLWNSHLFHELNYELDKLIDDYEWEDIIGVEALQKAYEVTEANTISKLPVGQKLLAMLHKAIEYKTGIFFFF